MAALAPAPARIDDAQIGGTGGFPLESASVWNISGLVPESSNFLRLAAALGIATAVSSGVAACGPSGGGGTSATYAIQFTLSDTSEDLTKLSFSVAYSGGEFVDDGASVDCSLIDSAGDSATFTDDDSDTLEVVITATTDALEEEQDIVLCDFEAASQPTANNFTITIVSKEPTDAAGVAVVVSCTEPSGETCEPQ